MASVRTDLYRKHMKQIVVTVRVKPQVNIPVRVGLVLIRMGVWVAGLTYRIERDDGK